MKNGITKEQSKMIQGLAILMMLYHHLFATPEIFGIEYFSHEPFLYIITSPALIFKFSV